MVLLTYEPGGKIWERFGHNALWIHDSVTGRDDHYDYGRFSFERPHFVLRFLQGRMWYSMGYESNVPGVIAAYAREGRKIWAQELELSPAQRLALREYLERNYRPENREYFYDYYRDNCSTRIRDALEHVLGGAIRRYAERPSGMTWRDETRRLNENRIPLYTGLLLALGEPVDRTMSRWEQMFLPMRLREHLDSVAVTREDGSAKPLVRSERVLNDGGRWPVPDRPSNWLAGYCAAGILIGLGFALLGATRLFMPMATLWALLIGVLGLVITYLWALSYHVAAHQNENILLCNLLALAFAVTLPSASRGRGWARGPAHVLAWILVAAAGFALVLKLFPGTQHNLEGIALLLPAHLGVAIGLERCLARLPSARVSAPS